MTKEPYNAPFVVAVDTREITPFPLLGFARVRKTLKTGDYSIVGLENRITIERKSHADLWGSMTTGRTRFERCVKRMATFEYAAIVVECTLSQAAVPPSYIKSVSPASVIGGLCSWSVQYNIPIWWSDTREYAERICLRLLASFVKHRGVDES